MVGLLLEQSKKAADPSTLNEPICTVLQEPGSTQSAKSSYGPGNDMSCGSQAPHASTLRRREGRPRHDVADAGLSGRRPGT